MESLHAPWRIEYIIAPKPVLPESLFTTISVMSHTIVTEKLKSGAPDLVVRPNVGIFRMLDFFQASAILRAAEGAKAEVKERLGALLAVNAAP